MHPWGESVSGDVILGMAIALTIAVAVLVVWAITVAWKRINNGENQ